MGVEIRGFEPRTPCMPCRCSSQLSYIPKTSKSLSSNRRTLPTMSGCSSQLSYIPKMSKSLSSNDRTLPTMSGCSSQLSYIPKILKGLQI